MGRLVASRDLKIPGERLLNVSFLLLCTDKHGAPFRDGDAIAGDEIPWWFNEDGESGEVGDDDGLALYL